MDISDGSKKHDDIEKKRSFIINVLYYAIITAIAFADSKSYVTCW